MVAEITPKAIEGFSGSERILVRDMTAVTLCNLLQDSLKEIKSNHMGASDDLPCLDF